MGVYNMVNGSCQKTKCRYYKQNTKNPVNFHVYLLKMILTDGTLVSYPKVYTQLQFSNQSSF